MKEVEWNEKKGMWRIMPIDPADPHNIILIAYCRDENSAHEIKDAVKWYTVEKRHQGDPE